MFTRIYRCSVCMLLRSPPRKDQFSPSTIQRTLSLTYPIFIKQAILAFDYMAFGFWMASYGKVALAAAAIIAMLSQISFEVSMRMLDAIGIIVPHAHGVGDYRAAGSVIMASLPYSIVGTFSSMLLIYSSCALLSLLHIPAPTLVIVRCFYNAYLWSMPLLGFNITFQSFLIGIQKPWYTVLINAAGLAFFLALLCSVMFTSFLPSMTIGTVLGLAFGVKNLASFLTSLVILRLPSLERYTFFHTRWNLIKSSIMQIARLGYPFLLLGVTRALMQFASMFVISGLGNTALTVRYVTQQLMVLPAMIISAFAPACRTVIGYLYSQRRYDEIRQSYTMYLGIAMLFSVGVALIMIAFPDSFISLYLNPVTAATAYAITSHVVGLSFLCLGFDFMKDVTTACLHGIGETQFVSFARILMTGVSLALGYLFAYPMQLGFLGIVLGQGISVAANFVLVHLRWRAEEVIYPSREERVESPRYAKYIQFYAEGKQPVERFDAPYPDDDEDVYVAASP
jgi:Na+-driven multidrug efflux pump